MASRSYLKSPIALHNPGTGPPTIQDRRLTVPAIPWHNQEGGLTSDIGVLLPQVGDQVLGPPNRTLACPRPSTEWLERTPPRRLVDQHIHGCAGLSPASLVVESCRRLTWTTVVTNGMCPNSVSCRVTPRAAPIVPVPTVSCPRARSAPRFRR